MSGRHPNMRDTPAECQPGDWLLASSVPQWSKSQVFHEFNPSEKPVERWTFRGSYFIDAPGDPVAIWRREERM